MNRPRALVAGDRPVGAERLGFVPYRSAVCRAVVALDVRSADSEHFHGSLSSSGSGDVHVLGIHADAHTVSRTPELICAGDQRFFKFTAFEAGSGLLIQDGRETLLSAGDLTIYDTSRPYSLFFDSPVQMSVLMFPHELLGVPADALAAVTATRLGGDNALRNLVRTVLGAAARQPADVATPVARHVCRGAMDLVEAVLESCLQAGRVPARSALMRHVLEYIDEHLESQELSPAQIAKANFISLRTLHGLFAADRTTVSTVIRTRRLERAYDALVEPRNESLTVATIAYRHGFADAAHFSRTFRDRFGVAPGSLRRSVNAA